MRHNQCAASRAVRVAALVSAGFGAAIAAELATMANGSNRFEKKHDQNIGGPNGPPINEMSNEQAAQLMNVSERSVKRAKQRGSRGDDGECGALGAAGASWLLARTLQPEGGTMTRTAERARQQRLRERRKSEGWRRVSIWLDPTEARTLEGLGDEWLGRTVKGLLSDAMTQKGQPQGNAQKPLDIGTEAVSDNAAPDYETVLAEAARLIAAGLSGEAVARELNARGWRSKAGAPLRGSNLKRDVRLREQRGAGV